MHSLDTFSMYKVDLTIQCYKKGFYNSVALLLLRFFLLAQLHRNHFFILLYMIFLFHNFWQVYYNYNHTLNLYHYIIYYSLLYIYIYTHTHTFNILTLKLRFYKNLKNIKNNINVISQLKILTHIIFKTMFSTSTYAIINKIKQRRQTKVE